MQSENKLTTHKVGRQPESCPRSWVLAQRWQPRWWLAGPPPENNWTPDARPDWKAAAGQVAFPHTRTQCSPRAGWWTRSHLVQCGCSEAGEKGGSRNNWAIKKDCLSSKTWLGQDICACITSVLEPITFLEVNHKRPLTWNRQTHKQAVCWKPSCCYQRGWGETALWSDI